MKLTQQVELLHKLATSHSPKDTINQLQQDLALRLPSLEPALELLDHLGVKRGDVYRSIVSRLLDSMKSKIHSLDEATIDKLLGKTLPLMEVPELDNLPMKLLSVHPNPPDQLLESLSKMGPVVAARLPFKVCQRMWESNLDAFMAHVQPLIDNYLAKSWHAVTFNVLYPVPIRLKERRKRNHYLQRIVTSIGTSFVLYHHVVLAVRRRFDETKETQLCSLRSEILMALHDAMAEEIWKKEPCHNFAWYIDAFVNMVNISLASGSLSLPEVMKKVEGVLSEHHKVIQGTQRVGMSQSNKDHVLRTKLAGSLQKELSSVLGKIIRLDHSALFFHPVLETDPHLVNHKNQRYDEAIETTMDTRTIKENVAAGKYKDVDDFRNDLEQIYKNSAKFWGEKNEISKLAKRIMVTKGGELCAASVIKIQRIIDAEKQLFRKHELALASKRSADSAKTTSANKYQPPDIQLKDRALKLVAISDAKMILANPAVVTALIHSLWFALRVEVFDQEILPRDAPTVKRIAFLLEQSTQAHDYVTRARKGETLQAAEMTVEMERRLLPMLTVYAHHQRSLVFEETQLNPDLLVELYKANVVVRQSILVMFILSLKDMKNKAMVNHLLACLVKAGVPTDFGQLGFYNSLAGVLESPGGSPVPEVVKLQILNDVLLRGVQGEVVSSSSSGTEPSVMCAELCSIISRVVRQELVSKGTVEDQLFKVTKQLFRLLAAPDTCSADSAMISDMGKQHLSERYFSPTFARAKANLERLFVTMPLWRSRCNAPSLQEVSTHKLPTASPTLSPSPMVGVSPYPSPSPAPSTPGSTPGPTFSSAAGAGTTPAASSMAADDGSGGSEDEDDDSDDGIQGTALKRPSPVDAGALSKRAKMG